VTIRKLGRALCVITVLQVLLCGGMVIYQTDSVFNVVWILMILSGSITMLGLYSVFQYQMNSFRESIQNLEKLNSKLREQRHDYLNQLQIVYGLLELDEYEEAREYLAPVFKDIMKVSKALKTSEPAVNALLQSKMEYAEKEHIDFYLEVGTSLSELDMEAWELCKVLGNLIDNAVTAVSEKEGNRQITLEMRETKTNYRFVIRNNGPKIPETVQELIFRQGFTTKKEEGHGMGLSIVASVLREAGGTISFTSNEAETEFIFEIPKRQETSNGKKRQVSTKSV